MSALLKLLLVGFLLYIGLHAGGILLAGTIFLAGIVVAS